jgi:hypothetical protein
MFRLFICLFAANFCKHRDLIYYGGKLIQNVKIITIWWGPNVKYKNDLETFYSTIVKSHWFRSLNEYNISSGSWERSINYKGTNNTIINDTVIRNELVKLIKEFSILPDQNYYFAIHLSSEISVITPRISCVDFYAYHSSIDDNIFYGVMPDCINKGRNLNSFDSITHASSHELSEAITDPVPYTGWVTEEEKSEIADLCNTYILNWNGYKLNSLYSNRLKRCISNPEIYTFIYIAFYLFITVFIIIGTLHRRYR